MSGNLDLVRSIYADWERGNFSSYEWAHPEIESTVADGPTPATRTGLAALEEGFRDFLQTFPDYRVTVHEYRELSDNRILVLATSGGRGQASGVPLGRHGGIGAALFRVRDGKVTRFVLYFDRAGALADLELEE